MSSPLVSRRCMATVTKNGSRAQCGNYVNVMPDVRRKPKCYLHGNNSGNELDRRFNELHTGGKYCWAVQPYPARPDVRAVGGSAKGLILARRDLTTAIKRLCPVKIFPMMAEALAMDASETWTDFPEYGLSLKVWRVD